MIKRNLMRKFFVDAMDFVNLTWIVLAQLEHNGWNIRALHHAEAILTHDLSGALDELETILSQINLPIEELVRGGGGEGALTQRLRNSLNACGWLKHNFRVVQTVDGVDREARTHEIDHVKEFSSHKIALEIEWNNKDPFFDRDLENFQRLHAVGAISVGVIITRGSSMQDNFLARFQSFAEQRNITCVDDLRGYYSPTSRQVSSYEPRSGNSFASSWARSFVADKFGQATTHWNKLAERMDRGVGNPCPLLLLGIPDSIITS